MSSQYCYTCMSYFCSCEKNQGVNREKVVYDYRQVLRNEGTIPGNYIPSAPNGTRGGERCKNCTLLNSCFSNYCRLHLNDK